VKLQEAGRPVRDEDLADVELAALVAREEARAARTIPLVASSSVGPRQMRAYSGSVLGTLTAEGYPGARFHPGCDVFDDVERLCVSRACAAFGASFANVQPHSCTTANQAALAALAASGARVLSMSLKAGGHLSHGAAVSETSRWYKFEHYGVNVDGLIDYDEVRSHALAFRPDVVICGASSYPRTLDFAAFGEIAREVGAALVADISHISGLTATGLHPSPVPHAALVTTSTYKQFGGPRGGLVLGGTDAPGHVDLARRVDRSVFPGLQGTPNAAAVAAKAWALRYVMTASFADVARRIVGTARTIADQLAARGFHVVSGGTETHMVLVDVSRAGIDGLDSERALEQAGILVNRNAIPHDPQPPSRPSGIRLGTNSIAALGASTSDAELIGDLVADVLDGLRPASRAASLAAATARARRAAAALLDGWRHADNATSTSSDAPEPL
jgi:glycine hydroxymethyltransferase